MMFLWECDIATGVSDDVDLSYALVPGDLVSYHREFRLDGHVGDEIQRLVCRLQFDSAPSKSVSYGFFGHTRLRRADQLLLIEPRLVLDLAYEGMEGRHHVFKLPGIHPGREYFEGCSGAPVIGTDGTIAGLVRGGDPERNLIFAVDVTRYRAALDVEVCGSST